MIFSNKEEKESTVNQAQEVGSNIYDTARKVIGPVIDFVKPGIDAALPLAKQAGEEVLKTASPVISDATKKAQEATESAGMDSQPVMTTAKTVVDAAQQTSKGMITPLLGYTSDPYARSFDPNVRCAYHSDVHGDSIEDCRALKREIKKMIQDKSIMVQNIDSEEKSSHVDIQISG
ncbi:Calcium sensing receptor, chloroplastic [Capsicum annuum]|uniref:Calcium sensing receptor, chloroplastic n=1 Tax=Capsicum annuum TaxID=4072 RepID=A0A2G2YR67_CAPAN|nr:Calcium sensing receptor, chloroplastic [Capsicum annuum]